ncbi:thaumatin family protein [Xylariaceae sp. FL0804]|nr:thaumatin family protein [Xylariaceae sp. FL0804]
MTRRSTYHGRKRGYTGTTTRLLSAGLLGLLSSHVPQAAAVVFPTMHELHTFSHLGDDPLRRAINRPLSKRDGSIPLIITNNCGDTLWPGIATQNGDPPESNGFELDAGDSKNMNVGPTWQGRVWGRTNCTVSADDNTATCETGDCFGKLDCEYGGATPVTLAEFNLAGGTTGKQTFYDISLVDGYNLPLGIVYHASSNTSFIPPNLVNPSCIGTAGYLQGSSNTGDTYTNSTYPMPYETKQTNSDLATWCPWDLQEFPPDKPGDGVYPYPDDNIARPVFDPCKSACAATNSPKDCCTGSYSTPSSCKPGLYSQNAKAMCPDAYSYAYDDQTSTFIIPSGGGWEVVFCPDGRSTNILQTFGDELHQIAESGNVTPELLAKAMNVSYIESVDSAAPVSGAPARAWVAVLAAIVGAVLLR